MSVFCAADGKIVIMRAFPAQIQGMKPPAEGVRDTSGVQDGVTQAADELLCSVCPQAYAQFAGAPLKLHHMSNPWRSPSGETQLAARHHEKNKRARGAHHVCFCFQRVTSCSEDQSEPHSVQAL